MYSAAAAYTTEQDYLAFEAGAQTRHELIDGQVIAMAGASAAHNQVCANLIAALHGRLTDRPCVVLTSDQRLFIEATGSYVYPDITVACRPFEWRDEGLSLSNPRVVIEVLSPSTRAHDQGLKYPLYEQIPSLTDIIFVDLGARVVRHGRRLQPGQWLVTVLRETGVVELGDLGIGIGLPTIFAKLDLFESALGPTAG